MHLAHAGLVDKIMYDFPLQAIACQYFKLASFRMFHELPNSRDGLRCRRGPPDVRTRVTDRYFCNVRDPSN